MARKPDSKSANRRGVDQKPGETKEAIPKSSVDVTADLIRQLIARDQVLLEQLRSQTVLAGQGTGKKTQTSEYACADQDYADLKSALATPAAAQSFVNRLKIRRATGAAIDSGHLLALLKDRKLI